MCSTTWWRMDRRDAILLFPKRSLLSRMRRLFSSLSSYSFLAFIPHYPHSYLDFIFLLSEQQQLTSFLVHSKFSVSMVCVKLLHCHPLPFFPCSKLLWFCLCFKRFLLRLYPSGNNSSGLKIISNVYETIPFSHMWCVCPWFGASWGSTVKCIQGSLVSFGPGCGPRLHQGLTMGAWIWFCVLQGSAFSFLMSKLTVGRVGNISKGDHGGWYFHLNCCFMSPEFGGE